MTVNATWKPQRILQVIEVFGSSTKPLLVETDAGPALFKYFGNPQGPDSLVAEFLAAGLGRLIDLPIPESSLLSAASIEVANELIKTEAGTGFVSKWQTEAFPFSEGSELLSVITNIEVLSQLVVFDTWIRNPDRFSGHGEGATSNYDNLLFVPHKSKLRVVVIDHTHAFVSSTFEDEMMDVEWSQETEVFGLFPSFDKFLDQGVVNTTLERIAGISKEQVLAILDDLPVEWSITSKMKQKMTSNILARGKSLSSWLPNRLFDQGQFDLQAEEKQI